MPNVTFVDRGEGIDQVTNLFRPTLLFVADLGDALDRGQFGPYAVLYQLASIPSPVDSVAPIAQNRFPVITDVADGAETVNLPTPVPVYLDGITDVGDTADVLAPLVTTTRITLADISDGVDLVGLVPPIPTVRAATIDEMPGAVNLVRNPSLELDAAGWSTASPGTGARVAGGWVGSWQYDASIPSGTETVQVVVGSYPALGLVGGLYVGSVHLKAPVPVTARLFLRLTYTDATTSYGTEASGGLWSPASLSELLAWYRGIDLALTDGAQITSWPDAGPNGWTASVAAGSHAPTFVAAESAALFARASQQYLDITSLSASQLDRTVGVVYDIGSIADEGAILGSASAGAFEVDIGLDARFRVVKENLAILGQSTNAVSTTGYHVLRATARATTWETSVDGTANGGSHAQTLTAGLTASLGRHVAAEYADGKLREAVIAAALPTIKAQRLEGYLAWTAGLQASLPSGHPFKAEAPLAVAPAAIGTTWTALSSYTATADPARTLARIDLVAEVPQTGSTQTISADGAQIESDAGLGATSYVDGDQGDGYAWSGVPHASMSTRQPLPREGGYL